MRFWDSSAIVPLLLEQAASPACRSLLRADSRQVVWMFTRTEVVSALQREHRSGGIDDDALRGATRRLDRLAARWTEVDVPLLVRDVAERLLIAHALRAADALQLGAALVAIDQRARGRSFVVLDDALGAAAAREGFEVLRPGRPAA